MISLFAGRLDNRQAAEEGGQLVLKIYFIIIRVQKELARSGRFAFGGLTVLYVCYSNLAQIKL